MAVAIQLAEKEEQAQQARAEAVARRADSMLDSARIAFLKEDHAGARARLRTALEQRVSLSGRFLWWLQKQEPLLWQVALRTTPYGIALLSDGECAVINTSDKVTRLYDVATAQSVRLATAKDQPWGLALSRDEKWVAIGYWSGQVRLVELESLDGFTFQANQGGVLTLDFSNDGARLATTGARGTITVWELSSRPRKLAELKGHSDIVSSLDLFADGRRLLSTDRRGKAILWDIDRGLALHRVRFSQGYTVGSVSPDESRFALVGQPDRLDVFSISDAQRALSIPLGESTGESPSWHPNGRLIAVGSGRGTHRLVDLQSGAIHRFEAHQGRSKGVISRDGTRLLTRGKDRAARVWDLQALQARLPSMGHEGGVTAVRFAKNGKLVSAGYDGTVRQWSAASGVQLSVHKAHPERIHDVQVSPDGRWAASAAFDETIRLTALDGKEAPKRLVGHAGAVVAVAFSADGKHLFSRARDHTIRRWPLDPEGPSEVIAKTSGVSISMAVTERWIAVNDAHAEIARFDRKRRRFLSPLIGHKGRPFGLAIHQDRLFSGSVDGSVRAWSLKTGAQLNAFQLPGRIYFLDVDPKGQRVVAPSSTGDAFLVDLESGQSQTMEGHRGEINSAVFSQDGIRIATASDDGTVRLWETSQRSPPRALWRAPLMRAPFLYTHQGRLDLLGRSRQSPLKRWEQRVLEAGRAAAFSPSLVCIADREDQLERWDPRTDRLLGKSAIGHITQLRVNDEGCLFLADGIAQQLGRQGTKPLSKRASAIGASWIAEGSTLRIQGRTMRTNGVITAALPLGDAVLVGYEDGGIERLGGAGEEGYLQTPGASVVAFALGPPGVFFAGFSNGVYGAWHTESGARLFRRRIHGTVRHLRYEGDHLFVGSDLGQHRLHDLKVLRQDACALLQDVWDAIPAVWESGQARRRAAPSEHACFDGAKDEARARAHRARATPSKAPSP